MNAHFHPMHSILTDTEAGRAALDEYTAARESGQSHDQAEMVASNVLQRAGYNVNARGGVTILRTVDLQGKPADFDAAVELMDDDIREALHDKIAPCSDQAFIDAYVAAHAEAFGGEAFNV